MKIAIITCSSVLIASQTAKSLHQKGFKVVGIDNDMRAYFFGKELPDNWKSIDDVIFDYLVYTGKKIDVKVDNELQGMRGKLAQYVYKPTIKFEQKLDINGWFDVHATY